MDDFDEKLRQELLDALEENRGPVIDALTQRNRLQKRVVELESRITAAGTEEIEDLLSQVKNTREALRSAESDIEAAKQKIWNAEARILEKRIDRHVQVFAQTQKKLDKQMDGKSADEQRQALMQGIQEGRSACVKLFAAKAGLQSHLDQLEIKLLTAAEGERADLARQIERLKPALENVVKESEEAKLKQIEYESSAREKLEDLMVERFPEDKRELAKTFFRERVKAVEGLSKDQMPPALRQLVEELSMVRLLGNKYKIRELESQIRDVRSDLLKEIDDRYLSRLKTLEEEQPHP
jgi:hypothetical protein